MFETTKKYLAEILNQKNKLINTLDDKGISATTKDSLEELTLKLERLGATYFCARGNSDHKVILRLKGTGNVSEYNSLLTNVVPARFKVGQVILSCSSFYHRANYI